MLPGVVYALLAGFLGAVASSSAKLSLGADYLKGVCETGLRTWGEQRKFRQADETTACDRAFLGQLIFGEAQMTLWWVGISLTFSGLLVLQRVSPQDGQRDTAIKDE
ncbi:hypothetical protein EYF80_027951 [Liparis tanakae]|uniref:Transmembrane protein 42 n=1 Tax=Liparis tanakae TaxID=230148 RepID=A0A4Z2HAC1_9TELE|nr:hypothetical protein EYF80_027951 [Liparis tanakae]